MGNYPSMKLNLRMHKKRNYAPLLKNCGKSFSQNPVLINLQNGLPDKKIWKGIKKSS